MTALRRAADREAKRRARKLAPDGGPNLDNLADGHVKQLAFTQDGARWIIALCSRRAGKTTGIAFRALTRALRGKSNQVYVALTKDQARTVTMWEPIWKPLLRRLGIEAKHDETRMITTFSNGSVIRFTGTDDVRHIETELGSALDEATIDEAQSQSDSVLVPLVRRILPPALADRRGTLVLAGTVPDVEAGLFWDTWAASSWSKHNWSMFDNPHMPGARAELDEYLAANPGLSVDSPVIQRERFGRFAFDKTATAYTYDRKLNGYAPEVPKWLAGATFPDGRALAAVPWPEIEVLSVGIDPGSTDRMAVEVIGWGARAEVQHVFEWVSPRAAHLTWNQLGEVLGVVAAHYDVYHWHYDAGSSKNELDTFTRLYNVPVIKAAEKSDLAGQVRMVNSLLTSGRLKVIEGSALEEDMRKARWDQDARAKGQWRWASAWHPDPADAARYAARPYFDMAPVALTPEEAFREAKRASAERAERNRRMATPSDFDQSEFVDGFEESFDD